MPRKLSEREYVTRSSSASREAWELFGRLELLTLLRLTEPRSGPRLCEAQRLRFRVDECYLVS